MENRTKLELIKTSHPVGFINLLSEILPVKPPIKFGIDAVTDWQVKAVTAAHSGAVSRLVLACSGDTRDQKVRWSFISTETTKILRDISYG